MGKIQVCQGYEATMGLGLVWVRKKKTNQCGDIPKSIPCSERTCILVGETTGRKKGPIMLCLKAVEIQGKLPWNFPEHS